MTRTLAVLIGLLFSRVSIDIQAKCASLDDLHWLNHRWSGETKNKVGVETWSRVSNKSIEGVGQSIDPKTGEVHFSESLRILEMGDQIFYLAKVKENTLPIAFKLIECSSNTLIFENTQHDFPQRLEYQRKSKKGLNVIVSGEGGRSFTQMYERQGE